MKRSMLNKIVLGGLSALLLAMSAGQAQAEQGEPQPGDEGKAVQVGAVAAEQQQDRYLVVLLMRNKTRYGSLHRVWFTGEPKYEAIVNDAIRRQGPPRSMLGRVLCGQMDPVACAEARPDRNLFPQNIDIIYEGEPEGARALLTDLIAKCNLPWAQNPCQIHGELMGFRDERLLEQIPPGAKRVMVARGTIGAGVVGEMGFGGAMLLCYAGPCEDRSAMLDELFWSGIVPMLNLAWISEADRPGKAAMERQ